MNMLKQPRGKKTKPRPFQLVIADEVSQCFSLQEAKLRGIRLRGRLHRTRHKKVGFKIYQTSGNDENPMDERRLLVFEWPEVCDDAIIE